ncbi:hypothetical protein FGO68_gene17312 [Halteria grandinella]|uniref:Uncharacterized protein n=1 Tax=Halteria grandinella TaxID=5974 RepID=A0A8J8SXC8_HALGN|nr:hypothetical protein FGO68_gene17312 [Halteria grandinella]
MPILQYEALLQIRCLIQRSQARQGQILKTREPIGPKLSKQCKLLMMDSSSGRDRCLQRLWIRIGQLKRYQWKAP